MTLRISSNLSLPDEAARWRFGFLAISGAGKTYDACVLAEEMIKNKIPVIAIDSLGIWWGLRVGVEGHEGLPVVIFGGEHQDVAIPTKFSDAPKKSKGKGTFFGAAGKQVDEERIKELVKSILQSGISCVLDTSEFSKAQQRRVVGIFAEELVRLNRSYGIRHVFIEEADNWVPQRSSGETAFVAGAINDLVRRGGNFLIGSTLISQRPAVVNKDVLTQISCLVALQILAKHDKDAVKTWIESAAAHDEKINKWVDSLKTLKPGEAWVWHPGEPEILKRVQFRRRETLHATRDYFLQTKLERAAIEPVDVNEYIAKFKSKFEPEKALPKAPVKDFELPREPIPQSAANLPKAEETKSSVLPKAQNEVLDLKFEPIKVHFDRAGFQVRELSTKDLRGQVAWILYHEARAQELLPWQIAEIGSNYGWLIGTANFKRDMKAIIEDGTITETSGGRYKAPKFVIVEFEEPHPGRTEAVRQ